MFFWLFVGFVIFQRLLELIIAKRNERKMIARGAIEFDKAGYKYIVAMHVAFFVSLIIEEKFRSSGLNVYSIIFLSIFAAAQLIRYWALVSLGYYWNTKIIVLKTGALVKKGPYKYFKHPNYAAVIAEFAVIPLVFSCYITFVVFIVLNIIVLNRRIKIENKALKIYNT